MKILCVVRHAKSSWPFGTDDFDRPLNDRGKRDAPEMGKRLKNRNIPIDVLVSSPAKRAFTTSSLFAEEMKYSKDNILVIPELYHAPVSTFVKVTEQLNDKFTTAAIFSHNPGITEFVNTLIENVRIDNMPTSGIFAVASSAENWRFFFTSELRFLFFDYPKLS